MKAPYGANGKVVDLVEQEKQIRAEFTDEYKWMSVKDKMPSDFNCDWVLVLPFDGEFRCVPTVAEYRNGHWWNHTLSKDVDCIDGEGSPFEVKYWKPLYDEFLEQEEVFLTQAEAEQKLKEMESDHNGTME